MDETGKGGRTGLPDETEPYVVVVVEIPQGCRNKYEMEAASGKIFLDRTLFTSTRYPADYGFIDETLGEDGDPLDALVLVGEPTFPGCHIRARPVGLFRMWDEKGPDEKILCVPLHDPSWSQANSLSDIQPSLLAEIEHFFQVYKALEHKPTGTEGYEDRDAALRVIEAARRRLQDHSSP